ncbi:MAG TPA: cytochrome ubiquinol oxidase subunit I [Acidimicrobiia bacterium]|nr:cytochrome ubiquinol oxidase subunit I [Acidimicrobiia bacterium]
MNSLDIARWQFGLTTVYHFLMVPLTIGLSGVVAWFHYRWYKTEDETYLRLTKFFGKLFLINFAMGVVTGIVQEFQFGMGWASYSRFVGDVFGAPLAMEALVAFFLESTFIGLWIFGWGRLPKKIHMLTMWAVAIGTSLSAYFIIAANSWMQHPVGVKYNSETQRAELTSISKVLTNSTTLAAYPHVIFSAFLTAAVFVGGVSAWLLIKRKNELIVGDAVALRHSMKVSAWIALVASVLIVVTGHFQTRLMFEQQPIKMASAEALCEDEKGAGFSVFAIGDVTKQCDVFNVSIPKALSLLATDKTDTTIRGVNDLNSEYQSKYGPGDYVPNLAISYWGFRLMIGFGLVSTIGAGLILFKLRKDHELPQKDWIARASILIIFTPFLANAFGWIFTEMGRQPWVVVPNPTGIPEVRMMTKDAVSSNVPTGTFLTSILVLGIVYAVLMVFEIKLLCGYIKAGPSAVMDEPDSEKDPAQLTIAY